MKILIITDSNKKVLGAVRADPITVGKHTVQAVAHPNAGQTHHEVEVDEDFFRKGRAPDEVEQQPQSMPPR